MVEAWIWQTDPDLLFPEDLQTHLPNIPDGVVHVYPAQWPGGIEGKSLWSVLLATFPKRVWK
jgi:hypothetical protein